MPTLLPIPAVAAALLIGWLGLTPDPPATESDERAGEPPASASSDPESEAESTPPEGAEDGDAAPVRVIVEVSRQESAMGTLELATDDVIVIRERETGEARSFPRGRIARLVVLTEPEAGQTGRVILRNGEVRTGTILRDTWDDVVLEIESITIRLPRAVVHEVLLDPTFEQQLQANLLRTDMNDPVQLHELCTWLIANRKWKLAATYVDQLWTMSTSENVGIMRRMVYAQLALLEESAAPKSPSTSEPEAAPFAWPLTDADVNLMRVYEIDFRDPPKVHVNRDTVEQILSRYRDHELMPTSEEARLKLYGARSIDLVRLLFRLRARDLYPDIDVMTEPPALDLFRRRVHDTWLVPNCATSECHGGAAAGRFQLYDENHRDPRVRYANLLALERLPMTQTTPLLDYQTPLNSLLIQYALPRDVARTPHPVVAGWRPAFRSTRDRKLEYAVEWIRGMLKPRPEYPVPFIAPPIADADHDPNGR